MADHPARHMQAGCRGRWAPVIGHSLRKRLTGCFVGVVSIASRVGVAVVVVVASSCSPVSEVTEPSPSAGSVVAGQIDCNVIDESAPGGQWTVVGGVVGLAVAPKTDVLVLADSQDAAEDGMRWWTKTPIYVRPGTSWALAVDGAAVDHVRMGWGSPAMPRAEVLPPLCPDRTPPASGWWVFPGGFWVDRPGCYTLRLTADSGSTLIRVPLGQKC